jgi:hypothetical protein
LPLIDCALYSRYTNPRCTSTLYFLKTLRSNFTQVPDRATLRNGA